MIRRIFLYLLPACLPQLLAAQNPIAKPPADCIEAIYIDARGRSGPYPRPRGFGNLREFTGNSSDDPQFIREEHHSAWMTFTSQQSGEMTFQIIPQNTSDDYDFMLFRYDPKQGNEESCKLIRKKKTLPLRSNISRNDTSEKSITGLSLTSDNEYMQSGPGAAFSKSVAVKKGDKFLLMIDHSKWNDSTRGYFLWFKYHENKHFNGTVVNDENGEPVKGAEVSWENNRNGNVINSTTTDEMGKFSMDILIDKSDLRSKFDLVISGAGYFYTDTTINLQLMKADTVHFSEMILPVLRVNKNIALKNINFFGGSITPLPESKKTFRKLYRIMKRNEDLKIVIEGHTNAVGDYNRDKQQHARLSEGRARTIFNYLVEKGISADRLETTGYGYSKMLFPNENATERQRTQNRRVEIKVLAF